MFPNVPVPPLPAVSSSAGAARQRLLASRSLLKSNKLYDRGNIVFFCEDHMSNLHLLKIAAPRLIMLDGDERLGSNAQPLPPGGGWCCGID